MDLSYTVQSLYATRAQKGDYIPTPSLKIIPSLYELSLASLMPEFINSNCQNLNAPDKIIADLVQRLPDTTQLSQVCALDIDDFWKLRLTHHFGVKIAPQQPGEARLCYLRNVMEVLASGAPYKGFPIDSDTPLLAAVQLFGREILQIQLKIMPDSFNYSEILCNLTNLEQITLIFDDPILDPNSILAMNTQQALLYTAAVDETQRGNNYLRTKKLADIARCVEVKDFNLEFLVSKEMQASDSLISYMKHRGEEFVPDGGVFPFHQMPDFSQLNQVQLKSNQYRAFPAPEFQSSVSSSRISNQDVVGIANSFKSMQKLKQLKIFRSQLNSQQSDIICQGLRQFNLDSSNNVFSHLSLPYNQINDAGVRFLMKLTLKAAGVKKSEIVYLDIRGNMLTSAGASFIGLALGSQETQLQDLLIAGNGIKKEGFILIANGILKQSVKFGQNILQHLDISGCGINFDEELLVVLNKLRLETGLQTIKIYGNDFSEGIYDQINSFSDSQCQVLIDWKKEEEIKKE